MPCFQMSWWVKGDDNEKETLEQKDICSENVQIAKGVTLNININVSK